MAISNEEIDRLGELARLRFTEEEKASLKADLERILEFVDQLNAIDTSGIEPLIHISTEVNQWRADEAHQTISQEEALKNAPDRDSDYFKVPKVIS